MADLKFLAPIAGIQIEYNLIERSADRELLPMAEALGLGVAFWSPLAGGTLTGKYRTAVNDSTSRLNAWGGTLVKEETGLRETAIINALEKVAQENNCKVLDIALAWLRQKHDQTSLSTVTIIGPRNEQQLVANLESLKITLPEEQIHQLNEISDIPMGALYETISANQVNIFGNKSGLVKTKAPVQ
jgi:aryl-alcohol dehydrogenase-like predicted oxidoreductase